MRKVSIALYCFFVALTINISAQSYQYPQVPDSITDRHDRVLFLATHFWDDGKAFDSTLFETPKCMLDYLYLLNNLTQTESNNVLKRMMDNVANSKSINVILFWFEHYLHDCRSPLYNDELYLALTEIVLAADIEEWAKLRMRSTEDILRRNRIGYPAEDFVYTTIDGEKRSLYSIQSPITLVFFHNPDCSLCLRAESILSVNDTITELLRNNKMRILAMIPQNDSVLLKNHHYDENWDVGYDKDVTIFSNRLYDIQTLPSMYLHNEQKEVIVKEADYNRIVAAMREQIEKNGWSIGF